LEVYIDILIDTREKNPYEFARANVERIKLETGDYTLRGYENILAIEHKASCSELAGNVTEKRYVNWTSRLAAFPHKFLICDFSLHDIQVYPAGANIPRRLRRKVRIRGPFILKKLGELEELGINIILAGNRESAKQFILDIFERALNGKLDQV